MARPAGRAIRCPRIVVSSRTAAGTRLVMMAITLLDRRRSAGGATRPSARAADACTRHDVLAWTAARRASAFSIPDLASRSASLHCSRARRASANDWASDCDAGKLRAHLVSLGREVKELTPRGVPLATSTLCRAGPTGPPPRHACAPVPDASPMSRRVAGGDLGVPPAAAACRSAGFASLGRTSHMSSHASRSIVARTACAHGLRPRRPTGRHRLGQPLLFGPCGGTW